MLLLSSKKPTAWEMGHYNEIVSVSKLYFCDLILTLQCAFKAQMWCCQKKNQSIPSQVLSLHVATGTMLWWKVWRLF